MVGRGWGKGGGGREGVVSLPGSLSVTTSVTAAVRGLFTAAFRSFPLSSVLSVAYGEFLHGYRGGWLTEDVFVRHPRLR
jgi:hypothetical protein